MTVFLADKWEGEPEESEEMAPKWFEIGDIPYSQMWEDDQYWLPQVIAGVQIQANFLFDENQKMLEKEIYELS